MSDAVTSAQPARRPPALEAYAVAVLLLVGLGEPPLPGPCVLGDLRTYLAGRVPAALAPADFDSTSMAVGFGKAAVGDWQNLGDAVVAAGRLYLHSTAVDTPEYSRLVRATRFRTPSFAFLPAGARWPARLQPPVGIRAGQLVQALAARHPRGVLVAGHLHFQRLELWTVSRPAIHGRALAEHVTAYYTEPLRAATDTWAYVIGIAARQPLPVPQRDDAVYQRLLPPRAGTPELYALYALQLASPPADPEQPPDPLAVLDVGQVGRGSVIAAGALQLRPFATLATCDPPLTGRGGTRAAPGP